MLKHGPVVTDDKASFWKFSLVREDDVIIEDFKAGIYPKPFQAVGKKSICKTKPDSSWYCEEEKELK